MLTISDSISMMLKPAPRPRRSRIPGESVALYRFAIVRSNGRNHTCCCAVARNAGYIESDLSTASSGVALMRKIAAHPRPIVAASAIVSAAGSAVGTSCANTSKPSSPIQPTSMASRGTITHVLSKAVTRTNWMMAEGRSDLFSVFAASMSPWPRATPSRAVHWGAAVAATSTAAGVSPSGIELSGPHADAAGEVCTGDCADAAGSFVFETTAVWVAASPTPKPFIAFSSGIAI